MSDAQTDTSKSPIGQGSKLLVDVGPAAIFMISYNIAKRMVDDQAIYWATGIFMLATVAAVAYALITQKRFPPMLAVTFVIVTLFGGMTIYLQDPIFIFIKPTIINMIFCFAILISFALGFNVWKRLFGSIYSLPDHAWVMLGIRWALFFAFLALLNEVMWRHIVDAGVPESARWFAGLELTEGFWVNFRFFGTFPLFFVFVLANAPLVMKYNSTDEKDGETKDENA
ncbi:inner membrane-spanning protein YciB [Oceanicaulis sp. LC35]|uniref:inner membrane-spanning protein YciB n=1 Tax=Oceanicaulis sp. LC35 TaxID=3349635 RepID=UPI003F86D553